MADDLTVLVALRRLIADDAYAITFQTFGQYRTALLRALDNAASAAGLASASPERDHCTDPLNCRRCKAATQDQQNHEHAGIPVGTQRTHGVLEPRKPDGYAYDYDSPFGGIRFNNGEPVNGSKPTRAIPYWLGAPPNGVTVAGKVVTVRQRGASTTEDIIDADGVPPSPKPQAWTDPEKEPRFQPGEET